MNLTMYRSMYDSNQFVFIQIKQVNDEEQLLRKFCCLYFEIKCNAVFPLISIRLYIAPSFNKHHTFITGTSPLISAAPLNAVLVRVVTVLLVARPKCVWNQYSYNKTMKKLLIFRFFHYIWFNYSENLCFIFILKEKIKVFAFNIVHIPYFEVCDCL